MGNFPSDISSTTSTSSSSTFEMIRQMSYESDVFYSDNASYDPCFNPPELPDITSDEFPKWRMKESEAAILKFMGKSYKPTAANLKLSAKKLAELSAAQKVPKFVSSTTPHCVKLHWACLVGWCMCKYQYQPMTPLHLMPHTKICSNVSSHKPMMTSHSLESLASSNSNLNSQGRIELYDETIEEIPALDSKLNNEDILDIMTKESTV